MASTKATPSPSPTKTTIKVGAGAFAGYQINQNLGIELGYDYLSKLKYSGTRNGAAFNDSVEAQLAQLTLKLGFPVADNLDLWSPRWAAGWTDSDELDSDSRFPSSARSVPRIPFNLDWAAASNTSTAPLTAAVKTPACAWTTVALLAAVYRFGQVARPCRSQPRPGPEPVVVDKQFTLSSDVLFDFNKATLKPEAGQALDTLYSQIEEARPMATATVIGLYRPHRLRRL